MQKKKISAQTPKYADPRVTTELYALVFERSASSAIREEIPETKTTE
jgi:hypothetical protein